MVERLLAALTRPRTPPAPEVPAAAFAALSRLHALHPPSAVESMPMPPASADASPSALALARPALRLVLTPRAWAPVDAAARAARSGAASAGQGATRRGAHPLPFTPLHTPLFCPFLTENTPSL
jgi:hypothetical protein